MIASYGFYFGSPWWLLGLGLLVPVAWIGRRGLLSLGRTRRILALACRALVVGLLVLLLARPTVTRRSEQLTVIAIRDRSRSIPAGQSEAMLEYVRRALEKRGADDRFAILDVSEAGAVARLPATGGDIPDRNTTLTGEQSDLADGVQLAMAIAPPDTAARIVLISDGNETQGDLAEAARLAAANGVAVDVLPVRYRHAREVVLQRLAAPSHARSGQTVQLRFVLRSTTAARGRLVLSHNGAQVDLDPDSPALGAPVRLKPGANAQTVSVPIGMRGMHEFSATFIPDDASQDGLAENNRASAITFVSGPGCVLVADGDGQSGARLADALRRAGIEVQYTRAGVLPETLPELVDKDAIVLVNADASSFSLVQQKMLTRYVADLGGGLVMVGGPDAFGAGGWIGSPLAEILPVDLDPPQKKQMPKGALVLVMHACEMPQGNYWGKRVGEAAVNTLSRVDLVGVLDYAWQGGASNWVYPLKEAGDKAKVIAAIKNMEMGDMPDLHAPLQAAYDALKAVNAGQKHVIVISDGDPGPPSAALLAKMKQAKITCTGVAVSPHSISDVDSLKRIAALTGGNFHNVQNPKNLPKIFVKEAQVVRRALIVEEKFRPTVTSISEIVGGLETTPDLEGYVLTGPRGGLAMTVMTTPGGDPVLASMQAGLGRTVAFTSSADSRWAGPWLQWGGYDRFWEQAVRWASKSSQSPDCDVYTDVQGRTVTVTVESAARTGASAPLGAVTGQVIDPDMTVRRVAMRQVGPGQYRGAFQATAAGSHLVNVQYQTVGADPKSGLAQSAVSVPYAPEFGDLTDNAPLLQKVAQATGGAMLGSIEPDGVFLNDPAGKGPFRRAGLTFPSTALPLTRPLILAWLALFLLDVAVRRIAVDFRALGRRAAALAGRLRKRAVKEERLDKLAERREALRRQWAAARRDGVARRRFDGADQAGDRELPTATLDAPRAERPPARGAEAPKPAAPPKQDDSPLGRLLRAKKKAQDRFGPHDGDGPGER